MDTSYYRNFITLIDTDNMTQAANILHLTQPALSKQLKYLEAEFGTPLITFQRGQKGKSFHLTTAGQIFYEKAKKLCTIEDETYFDVNRLNSDIEGSLHIACAASRSTSLIQQVLEPFARKYPAIKYEIYEGLSSDVENALLRGSAEIGVCDISLVNRSKFEVLESQVEEMYAVFRRDVFWSGLEIGSLTFDDLQPVPLSLCGGSIKTILKDKSDKFNQLSIKAITTTKASAIEWAQSGLTVALVPMSTNEQLNQRKLIRRRLVDITDTYLDSFIMATGHTLSLVAQQFLEFARALKD